MLLQIKVYWIGIIYVLGALFMFLFPPRNFDLSEAKIRTSRSTHDNLKFNQYVDYNILMTTIKEFVKKDPEVVNAMSLTPQTKENRSIVAIELRSDKQSRKPGILIIGGLDAMAWGAPSAILELSHKLLYDSNYQTPFFSDYDWIGPTISLNLWEGTPDNSKELIYSIEYDITYSVSITLSSESTRQHLPQHLRYFIPMANPDGIAFTQSIRLRVPVEPVKWSNNDTVRPLTRPVEWHKNVDKEPDRTPCFGTNINRNFAYHWQDDVQKTPQRCSQYYPGSKPFSTAEAKAIREYVDNLGAHISLAIHLHGSFVPKKEYILYPWRYSLRQPSNYRALQAIGEYAARMARLPDGRLYEVHQSSSDERVAGTLCDYVSGVVGIDLVFLLRPYHQMFPNYTDTAVLSVYVRKSLATIIGVVRGWRSSTKQNTLSFFGRDIEF